MATLAQQQSPVIDNLYYLLGICAIVVAAVGWLSRRLDKRINQIVPDSPTIKELKTDLKEIKNLVEGVKANGLPNGGKSMRDDIQNIAAEISSVKVEVAEHRGILDGIRLHFNPAP